MPFLAEHGSNELGVYISITIIIAATFLGMNNDPALSYIIPIYFYFVSGLVIIFWWRNRITKKYIDKVKAQEIKALQDTIAQKDAEIEKLKLQNSELSKIIHRDNKIIPALEYAVRQYLLTAESETEKNLRLVKAEKMLSQIEDASRERAGIIASYEASSRSLPSTGVASVDSLLLYMLQKSKEQQIDFNLTLSGSVKYLIENIATEQDVNTLLADLIENAIIATKNSASKNILVHIGIVDECYSIGVYDNGIPFSPETIKEIGQKRTTTHAGEGGSGIGLMTTFEIINRYNASFIIEDIDNTLYTKNVSVCFDQLGQFRVKSSQICQIEPVSARERAELAGDISA